MYNVLTIDVNLLYFEYIKMFLMSLWFPDNILKRYSCNKTKRGIRRDIEKENPDILYWSKSSGSS